MARGTLWDGRIINSQCFRCHRRYSGPIRMSHIATFSSRRFINRTHKFSQEICIQHLVPDSRRKTKIKTLATGEGWLWIFRRTCIMCNFSSSPTATIFRHFCRAFRTTFVWTWRCSAKQRSQIERVETDLISQQLKDISFYLFSVLQPREGTWRC